MKLFIHSQTSAVQPLKLEMDKWFHSTLYNGCNYLSVLGIKLIHVSKRGPREKLWPTLRPEEACFRQWTGSTLVRQNDLSPVRRQAIIWTSAILLSTGLSGTHYNEMWHFQIQYFSFTNMHYKMFPVVAATNPIHDSLNWCLKTPCFIDLVEACFKWKLFDRTKDAKTSLESSLGIKIYYHSRGYDNSLENQYNVHVISISKVLVLSTCQVKLLLLKNYR